MTYETIKPGEWLRPKVKGYKMKCCDCGLVHRLDFRVHTGRAEFRAYRDNRSTAAGRRERPATRSVANRQGVDGPKAVMPNRSGLSLSTRLAGSAKPRRARVKTEPARGK